MDIFITGASGFVGGAALKRLSQQHNVRAMSRSIESDKKIMSSDGLRYAVSWEAWIQQTWKVATL